MSNNRSWNLLVAVVATLTLYALTTSAIAAHGGGHGGGGHHAGGGHRGGAHRQPHPYRPSQHHAEHHAKHRGDHHDQFAHRNHHHESWHRGGWGPGYWDGAALGYGLGYAGWGGWGYDDGDTYVDDSTTVNPVSNESDDDGSPSDDSSDDVADSSTDANDNQFNAASPSSTSNFPVDSWPELGLVTYSGAYGASQGQVVVRVVPNSPGAKAGFVPGDVILEFNGQPTPSADAIDATLDTAKGRFDAQVWDARTGRTSTLSGQYELSAPGTGQPAPRDTAAAEQR